MKQNRSDTVSWFAGVGLYNAVVYEPRIFAAINPYYAFHFFARNGLNGWRMLGGILLCVTGTEAMFADLGHFNVPAIQVISPSLLLCILCFQICCEEGMTPSFYRFWLRSITHSGYTEPLLDRTLYVQLSFSCVAFPCLVLQVSTVALHILQFTGC